MHKVFVRINGWANKPLAAPLALLFLAILCYGLLTNRLGYYWDDYPLAFIYNVFGRAGLERYFSTNRPIWGLLYQITFSIFNQPWQWQLNALLFRWLSAVLVWNLIKELFPNHKKAALWISMLFLVYPGFKQQHISIIYSNLFIVLDCFLFSLLLNIRLIRTERQKISPLFFWLITGFSLLLSLFNLLALEYFFTLELLRPILIWFTLTDEYPSRSKKIKYFLYKWLPYLGLWIAVLVWRLFFFNYQTHNYQLLLIKSIRESPIQAILDLVKAIAMSLSTVVVKAWVEIFKSPDLPLFWSQTNIAKVLLILISFGFIILLFLMIRDVPLPKKSFSTLFFIGLFALFLGGIPWWITELPPRLTFPSDRFTLSFILGVCIVIVGVLVLLPIHDWIRMVLVGILVAFSVASHFQATNRFMRDWEVQQKFFWQLTWRIPSLVDNTTIMVNELQVVYYSDNSLTAPLNWFWAPSNDTPQLAYLLIYPSQRLGSSLSTLDQGVVISKDYLAAKFNGNTSQTVAIYYHPPACLRVLDHYLDSNNPLLPTEMKSAAALSSTDWIQISSPTGIEILPGNLYSPEPDHKWCYYYEKADIARQQDKWGEVASIGDTAYQLDDLSADPLEHLLFIEGYAHNDNWEKARVLSEQALNFLTRW